MGLRMVLSVLCLLTLGCASTSNVLHHPSHGIAGDDNEKYVFDREACRLDVYSRGVKVGDSVLTDAETLKTYEAEFDAWLFTEGLVFVVKGMDPVIPEEYLDLDRARKERNQCMAKKGWKK